MRGRAVPWQSPAHSRDFSGRLGAEAHFLRCGKLQRLFCQEAERLREYFIRGARAGREERLAGSPGRWEPVQEAGL